MDDNIENKLTDDLNYRYKEFSKETITRANYKMLSDDILSGTGNYAQHLEHDTRELMRLRTAINDERNNIKNQNHSDKILRDSIHYRLVDLCFQYIQFADDALSFNPVIINPLRRLVSIGSDIIEDVNHSEIFVDINKAVQKGIADNTVYLSANIKRLEDNYTSVDKEIRADMKSIERRLMTLEVNSNTSTLESPALSNTSIAPKESKTLNKLLIPRLSSDKLEELFKKFSTRVDDFNDAGTLKQNFKTITGVVSRLTINPEDINILQSRLEKYKDSILTGD